MAANKATQSSAPEDLVADQTNAQDASVVATGDDVVVDP